jgi:hypothetical protein
VFRYQGALLRQIQGAENHFYITHGAPPWHFAFEVVAGRVKHIHCAATSCKFYSLFARPFQGLNAGQISTPNIDDLRRKMFQGALARLKKFSAFKGRLADKICFFTGIWGIFFPHPYRPSKITI